MTAKSIVPTASTVSPVFLEITLTLLTVSETSYRQSLGQDRATASGRPKKSSGTRSRFAGLESALSRYDGIPNHTTSRTEVRRMTFSLALAQRSIFHSARPDHSRRRRRTCTQAARCHGLRLRSRHWPRLPCRYAPRSGPRRTPTPCGRQAQPVSLFPKRAKTSSCWKDNALMQGGINGIFIIAILASYVVFMLAIFRPPAAILPKSISFLMIYPNVMAGFFASLRAQLSQAQGHPYLSSNRALYRRRRSQLRCYYIEQYRLRPFHAAADLRRSVRRALVLRRVSDAEARSPTWKHATPSSP